MWFLTFYEFSEFLENSVRSIGLEPGYNSRGHGELDYPDTVQESYHRLFHASRHLTRSHSALSLKL